MSPIHGLAFTGWPGAPYLFIEKKLPARLPESLVTRSEKLLKPSLLVGEPFTTCKDFHFWRMVRNDIDKVVKTDEFVMQNFLDVTACVAHNVVEKV